MSTQTQSVLPRPDTASLSLAAYATNAALSLSATYLLWPLSHRGVLSAVAYFVLFFAAVLLPSVPLRRLRDRLALPRPLPVLLADLLGYFTGLGLCYALRRGEAPSDPALYAACALTYAAIATAATAAYAGRVAIEVSHLDHIAAPKLEGHDLRGCTVTYQFDRLTLRRGPRLDGFLRLANPVAAFLLRHPGLTWLS